MTSTFGTVTATVKTYFPGTKKNGGIVAVTSTSSLRAPSSPHLGFLVVKTFRPRWSLTKKPITELGTHLLILQLIATSICSLWLKLLFGLPAEFTAFAPTMTISLVESASVVNLSSLLGVTSLK